MSVGDQDEQIRRLMKTAFEEAFQLQMGHLYKIYLQNITSVGTKQRQATKTGIDNAIAAYRLAMEAVDSWEGSKP